MVAGDKLFEKMIGKDIKKLLDSDMLANLAVSPLDNAEKESGPRQMQLSAFIGVNRNMQVIYSHYFRTVADFPNIKEMIKALR